ncbi:Pyruvate/Phosphoenolpyruvate kinase-like domain-containing protein [Mycena epipterygia]|nr:Pyruvate/Phosphoenolpyruvate kinase-like domain-containing protein [Mycena epipterygia]
MSDVPKFTTDPSSQASWAAPTRQQSSNMRGLIASGKTLAIAGGDWIWIDTEHAAWSPTLLVEVIQIIIHESGGKMIPVVRLPNKTAFDYVTWCLDAGAGGIIIPHIETNVEVAAIVDACRFPPIGHRSYSPFTFLPSITDTTPDGESVYSLANKHIAVIPQIESRLGIKNIDSIMQMNEVDGVMIGVGDLRMDMGLSVWFVGMEPDFVAAMERVTTMSKKYKKALVGAAIGTPVVEERLRQGFTVLATTIDLHTLAFGTITELREAKATVETYMIKERSKL